MAIIFKNLDIMKYLKVIILLIFVLNCRKQESHILVDYFKNHPDIIEFCKEVVPCLKEEINNVFKDLPQQKNYLLTKTTVLNCINEQSTKITQKINLDPDQIKEIHKKKELFNYEFLIKSSILNQNQKEILNNYIKCSKLIKEKKECQYKKDILKKNEYCLSFFKE